MRAGVSLHTPLRDNMKDDRPKEVVKTLNNTRRIVETVIGQLSERFKIEKVRARDLWHLTVRAGRNCWRIRLTAISTISLAVQFCNSINY